MSTPLACARCLGPFGAGARQVRLLDQAFHEICAPCCQTCGSRLRGRGEENWAYDARVVSSGDGFRVEPTAFWCQGCWELGHRTRPTPRMS